MNSVLIPSPLQPGQKFKFAANMVNPVGLVYDKGSTLELIEPTTIVPHGQKSILGNWIAKCQHQTSVWSSIWLLVETGYLVEFKDED